MHIAILPTRGVTFSNSEMVTLIKLRLGLDVQDVVRPVSRLDDLNTGVFRRFSCAAVGQKVVSFMPSGWNSRCCMKSGSRESVNCSMITASTANPMLE